MTMPAANQGKAIDSQLLGDRSTPAGAGRPRPSARKPSSDTAIFITWDDWGGFYDHVKPPQAD
jgi:hypothetical protein